MASEQASELILRRLRDRALHMGRPEVRIGTLERLVESCDAIVSGVAADLVKSVTGRYDGLRYNPVVNPSNIEKYVKARKKNDRNWTGPTRVTIHKDPDLMEYVRSREDERVKPDRPLRPTDTHRYLEDAISKLASVEDRQALRHAIEAGRETRRRMDILCKGLRSIPDIDIDALLERGSGRLKLGTSSGSNINPVGALTPEERDLLRTLVERLCDTEELSRVGLEIDSDRVRHRDTRQPIVKPPEMVLLRRLAGMSVQSVASA